MIKDRKFLIVFGVIVAVVVAAAAGLYFFDWNLARGYVARRVSASTGRDFAINGNLRVHWALEPRITAEQITLGNAPWSKDPVMADVGQLDFRVNLLSAFGPHWVLPEVHLSGARVLLEKKADGLANWNFNDTSKTGSNPPDVGALSIEQGQLEYRDPGSKTDLRLDVSTSDIGATNPQSVVNVSGQGTYQGLGAKVQGQLGTLLSLRTATQPYPMKITLSFGSTQADADGYLIDPLHLKGEDINFKLSGRDLSALYPLVGVPIPPTPEYSLSGHLDHTGDQWTFKKFKGRIGQSDVAGDFTVDRGHKPQLLTAKLNSQSVNLADLGGFIGGDRGTRASPVKREGRVLPAEPFDLGKLRSADADIEFHGAKVVTQSMPIERMSAHLRVKDGVLTLDPLDFSMADGDLVSSIEMDARQPVMKTRADIKARKLRLEQLLPSAKSSALNVGTLGGRAQLEGTGNSVADVLGSANGRAGLIMDGGSISELTLRLMNLDIANAIPILLAGDRQVPARCMVGDFTAVAGDFRVKSLVIDTSKVNVTGSGDVNFADEALNLELVAKPRGFSLASLRGPILISGTFAAPKVRPDVSKVLGRGVAAVALGAATAGLGAFIPLFESGDNSKSSCHTLIADTESHTKTRPADIRR